MNYEENLPWGCVIMRKREYKVYIYQIADFSGSHEDDIKEWCKSFNCQSWRRLE